MKHYLVILFIVISSAINAQKTIIHCGFLIDGKSNDAQPQMTIVVEADKIVSITKGFASKGNEDILIDLSKKTVMPGLIDMHVHL